MQCGMPFYFAVPKKALYEPYWPERTCASASWIGPIWRERIAKIHERVPVLNLAAGSAQLWGSDGREVAKDRACREFVAATHEMCRLTTVRDSVAVKILKRLDLDAPLLPCTSIFARDRLGIEPAEPDLVCLNYMPRAGLYLPQKRRQVEHWRETFLAVFEHFRACGPVVVTCHAGHDVEAVRGMIDAKYVVESHDYVELLKLYARCRVGLFNRIHAAMVVASFGRPVVCVGTDTRMLMLEPLGMPFVHVDDASAERLIEMMERPAPVHDVRRETERRYRELIGGAL